MVSSSHRDAAPYDVFIEHSGTKLGYMVAEGEGGLLQYFVGSTPFVVEQRHEGAYGYDAGPTDIDSAISFENWHAGAGFESALDSTDPGDPDAGELASHKYSYSQGVDASWEDRLYISPERQGMSGITAAPTHILQSSIGTAVAAGGKVYSIAAGGAATEEVDTSGTITDLVEFENRVYAFIGDSSDYYHSAAGDITSAWTQVSTTVDDPASFMVSRGNSGSNTVAWKLTAGGALKNTTDPSDSGVAWSAAIQLGHSTMTFNNLMVANDVMYGIADEGIFSYDGVSVEDVFPAQTLAHADNGKHAILWVNGLMYFNFGTGAIVEFNPGPNTLRTVFPRPDGVGHPEVNGAITAIHGDDTHLRVAIKNAAGNTYILKGSPSRVAADPYGQPLFEWHTAAYLAANDCNAIQSVPAGVPHANNPAMVFGYGALSKYFIEPRENYRPEDDSNYRFDTGGGTIFGSWIDGGTRGFNKFLNFGRQVLENSSSAKTAQLLYGTNGSSSTTSIYTADSDGPTGAEPSVEVQFSTARYRITLVTNTNTDSPIVRAALFNTTPNPPPHRFWSMVLKVGDDLPLNDSGEPDPQGGTHLERHLFDALKQRVTFYDRRGRSFIVRMLPIQGAGAIARTQGDTELLQIQMAEISEIAQSADILVYATDSWAGTKRWGP